MDQLLMGSLKAEIEIGNAPSEAGYSGPWWMLWELTKKVHFNLAPVRLRSSCTLHHLGRWARESPRSNIFGVQI